MGSFPETFDDPFVLTDGSQIFLKSYRSTVLIFRMAHFINDDSPLIPTFLSLLSLV